MTHDSRQKTEFENKLENYLEISSRSKKDNIIFSIIDFKTNADLHKAQASKNVVKYKNVRLAEY